MVPTNDRRLAYSLGTAHHVDSDVVPRAEVARDAPPESHHPFDTARMHDVARSQMDRVAAMHAFTPVNDTEVLVGDKDEAHVPALQHGYNLVFRDMPKTPLTQRDLTGSDRIPKRAPQGVSLPTRTSEGRQTRKNSRAVAHTATRQMRDLWLDFFGLPKKLEKAARHRHVPARATAQPPSFLVQHRVRGKVSWLGRRDHTLDARPGVVSSADVRTTHRPDFQSPVSRQLEHLSLQPVATFPVVAATADADHRTLARAPNGRAEALRVNQAPVVTEGAGVVRQPTSRATSGRSVHRHVERTHRAPTTHATAAVRAPQPRNVVAPTGHAETSAAPQRMVGAAAARPAIQPAVAIGHVEARPHGANA